MNKYYITFLSAFRTLLNVSYQRNKNYNGSFKNNINLKLYNQDLNYLISTFQKYKMIMGISKRNKTIETLLRQLLKKEKIEENLFIDIFLEIEEQKAFIQRKIDFPRYPFFIANIFNNYIDIFIYLFLDYKFYFLKPSLTRTKMFGSMLSYVLVTLELLGKLGLLLK